MRSMVDRVGDIVWGGRDYFIGKYLVYEFS